LADPFSPRAVAGQPFSLTISTKDLTLKFGSEIVIDLALKNVSRVERNAGKSNAPRQAELYYQVLVTDSKGHAAKETRYARQITGKEPTPIIGSTVYTTLRPNEILNDDLLLNKLFELTEPGDYTVQLIYDIPRELGTGVIKSNKIRIKLIK
jgi:hypothetical protein